MHGHRFGLLLLACAFAAVAAAGVAAGEETEVSLTYEVGGLDPENGTADVDLVIEDPDTVIESMTFRTEGHRYPVSDVNATGGDLEKVSGGYKLSFDPGPTVFRFTVGVERETFKGSEGYNAYLADSWGVLKAESLGIGFVTRHDDRYEIVWDATLRFQLPTGWSVAGPWNRSSSATYELPDGDPLPRGFYAVGEDLDVTRQQGPWKEYRYVRIGSELSYRPDVFPYLEAATPYYESVYGNHTGWNLLAISAPDPMHEGGLGGWDSLYVHESTDLETLAHEYAHVWQRYLPVLTVTNPDPDSTALEGGSSVWIIEGDADYRGPLSLVATEFWSVDEADDHFEDEEAQARAEGRLERPLDQATYGNSDERVAYQKGALVLHTFQRKLAAATDGQADSATLVRTLNEEYSPVKEGYDDQSLPEQRVNNSEIRSLILDLASEASDSERQDLAEAFDGFVHGDLEPSFDSIERSGQLSFDELAIEPPTALEGDPSTARVRVTNTGPTEESRTVELFVEGQLAGDTDVTVGAGESLVLAFPLPDLEPGSYAVRVAYLEAQYRVLEPADFALNGVDLVPSQVVQGEGATALATVWNRGGAAGDATVEVALDGARQGAAGRTVDGGVNETLSVTFETDEAGSRTVEVTLLQGDEAVDSATRTLLVAPDADGDGVPDGEDAYPGNPKLSEKSAVNDARDAVPGPRAAALAALGLGAALYRRTRFG